MIAHITAMCAAVSQGGTDTQIPSSSAEMHHQSAVDENDAMLIEEEEGPVYITFPISQRRPEVSCIVCPCPRTHFINIRVANCRTDIHLSVLIKQPCLLNGN